jgi:hypothetical protein
MWRLRPETVEPVQLGMRRCGRLFLISSTGEGALEHSLVGGLDSRYGYGSNVIIVTHEGCSADMTRRALTFYRWLGNELALYR